MQLWQVDLRFVLIFALLPESITICSHGSRLESVTVASSPAPQKFSKKSRNVGHTAISQIAPVIKTQHSPRNSTFVEWQKLRDCSQALNYNLFYYQSDISLWRDRGLRCADVNLGQQSNARSVLIVLAPSQGFRRSRKGATSSICGILKGKNSTAIDHKSFDFFFYDSSSSCVKIIGVKLCLVVQNGVTMANVTSMLVVLKCLV